MADKLLSIFLGTGTAKLAEVAKNGKKVTVYSAYDITLSEGLCDDGVISDIDALVDELKASISKYKIKSKKLVFSIASKRIASKEVVIPFVKEKQIGEIVKINAPEYFPVANIEDYSLNYSIIEVVQTENNKQLRLSVTATPKEILEGYTALALLLKMPIETIDYAGNSILQVLKSQTLGDEVNAVLQLGRENTVINIMSGGVLIMQRSVSYGLDAVLQAVSEAFRFDEYDALAFIEDNDISRICSAYADVDDVVRTIFTSISRIFDYYNQRAGEHHITLVKYVGDGTIINGIGESLQEFLQIPVEEILTLNNVDVKGKSGLTLERATNFMANIGSVIAPVGMKFVSQGDEEEQAKEDKKLPWGLVVISAIAAILLIGASVGFYFITKTEVDELRAQKTNLESMKTLETQLNDATALSAAVADFYDATKGPNDSIYKLITDLEEILPKGTAIDTMSIDNGLISISASGIGKKSVAKLIMELKHKDYIDNVHVDYVGEISEGVEKFDSFTMTFSMKHVEEEIDESESSDELSMEPVTDTSDVVEESPVEEIAEEPVTEEESQDEMPEESEEGINDTGIEVINEGGVQ